MDVFKTLNSSENINEKRNEPYRTLVGTECSSQKMCLNYSEQSRASASAENIKEKRNEPYRTLVRTECCSQKMCLNYSEQFRASVSAVNSSDKPRQNSFCQQSKDLLRKDKYTVTHISINAAFSTCMLYAFPDRSSSVFLYVHHGMNIFRLSGC